MPTTEITQPDHALILAGERALVAPINIDRIEHHASWPVLAAVPMRLIALIQIPHFTVRDLLALQQGQVVETPANSLEDVPLRVGGVALAFSEFEVVEQRMAVRLTRLA